MGLLAPCPTLYFCAKGSELSGSWTPPLVVGQEELKTSGNLISFLLSSSEPVGIGDGEKVQLLSKFRLSGGLS